MQACRFSNQTLITDYYHPIPKIPKIIVIEKEPPIKKQKLLTDYYETTLSNKVYGFNEKTMSFHCLTCGVDMGPQNPRQLCGKWRCLDDISFFY